jgi:hypothetical protein
MRLLSRSRHENVISDAPVPEMTIYLISAVRDGNSGGFDDLALCRTCAAQR